MTPVAPRTVNDVSYALRTAMVRFFTYRTSDSKCFFHLNIFGIPITEKKVLQNGHC